MEPAKPPLPTPWNLPFQLVAGIQTSNWMSESDDGLRVAATRQKAGRSGMALPLGALKAPAATDSAVVMVAPGRSSFARDSQDWAARAWVTAVKETARDTATRVVRDFSFMASNEYTPNRGGGGRGEWNKSIAGRR